MFKDREQSILLNENILLYQHIQLYSVFYSVTYSTIRYTVLDKVYYDRAPYTTTEGGRRRGEG